MGSHRWGQVLPFASQVGSGLAFCLLSSFVARRKRVGCGRAPNLSGRAKVGQQTSDFSRWKEPTRPGKRQDLTPSKRQKARPDPNCSSKRQKARPDPNCCDPNCWDRSGRTVPVRQPRRRARPHGERAGQVEATEPAEAGRSGQASDAREPESRAPAQPAARDAARPERPPRSGWQQRSRQRSGRLPVPRLVVDARAIRRCCDDGVAAPPAGPDRRRTSPSSTTRERRSGSLR